MLLLLSCAGSRGLPSMDVPALEERIPMDPRVTEGVLDNGLRYLIEPTEKPKDRVELRLVLNAGSVLEDEDQQGLAHLVEHMAFNGSEHFDKNELIDTLEGMGVEFGAHLNASTSYDHTQYMLSSIPTDPVVLDTALTVLHDWAGGLTLDHAEIELERPVVIEEWRRGQGVRQRQSEAFTDMLFAGSRYADRRPIGTLESLQSFTPEAVERFYSDWYRPDLMTLVVVGDIHPATVEASLIERFSDLQNPAQPRERTEFRMVVHPEQRTLVQTDPEATDSSFMVTVLRESGKSQTWGDYWDHVVTGLALDLVNERLARRGRKTDAAYLGAGVFNIQFDRLHQLAGLGGQAPRGGVQAALHQAWTELERARRHGFEQRELDPLIKRLRAGWAQALKTQDEETSGQAIEELLRHVTSGETVPGTEPELQFLLAQLDTLTVEGVHARLETVFVDEGRLLSASLPEGDGLEAEDLLQVLDAVAEADIQPGEALEEVGELVSAPPEPGSVLEEIDHPEVDMTEWVLSNGARVLLKPTDFRDDEVRYRADAWGGLSLYEDEDRIAAYLADDLVARSGLGDHDPYALSRVLAGKQAWVRPWEERYQHGFTGAAAPEDLETLAQLVWLYSTAPRFTDEAYDRELASQRERLGSRELDPGFLVDRAWNDWLWQDHPWMTKWTLEELERWDPARSEAIYRDLHGQAAGLVHLFVGDFKPRELRPLVEQWLAAVPAGQERSFQDHEARPRTGPDELRVQAGTDPKASVRMRFSGSWESTPDKRHALRAMAKLLDAELTRRLREELGGTYSVSVSSDTVQVPEQRWVLTVRFGCDPERVDELILATEEALEAFRSSPPEPEAVQALAEQQRLDWEIDQVANGWWLGALSGNRERGEQPGEVLRYRTLYEGLSPEGVLATAQWALDPESRLLFVTLPEQATGVAFTTSSPDPGIDPVLRAGSVEVARCAEEHPVSEPTELPVDLKVTGALAQSVTNQDDTALADCVMRSMMAWSFPEGETRETTVTWTITPSP